MTIPTMTDAGYEYTEFDGRPLEWWKARSKKDRGPLSQSISPKDKPMLDALLPDKTVHEHVARIGTSEQGSTTLLTTSGHIIQIQFQKQSDEFPKEKIVLSRDVDAKGIAVAMSIHERFGVKYNADQLAFGKNADSAFQQHVRKLWAEARAQQKAPDPQATAPRLKTKTPAYV